MGLVFMVTDMSNVKMSGAGIDLDNLDSSQRFNILIVDDEPDMVMLLKAILMMSGFNVVSANSGSEGIKKLTMYRPDLVMLDLMMQDMDGWQTMRYMREISDVPVIVISALGSKEDIVAGFRRGVDDYVTKPFYKEEVVERVRAVLRRARKPQEISRLVFPRANMVIDLLSQEICLKGTSVRLTGKEFAVLSVLAKHAPSIVSYQSISEAVWGEDSVEARKRIKYLTYLIRHKFSEVVPEEELIVNIDRIGYRLETE
jgi:DNA-binding response OmpR family regulator